MGNQQCQGFQGLDACVPEPHSFNPEHNFTLYAEPSVLDPLPFELVDLILSNLDSHEDFKSYSLVSRAWCAPAQIRLFHTVSVQNGVQCLRLHNLLVDSPHTGEFIRFLSFRIDDGVGAKLASAILPLVKRLFRLTFFNGTWTWPGDRPHELSAILRAPIADILAQHPLTYVVLSGFSLCNFDLQELFICAPCLKRLVLSDFTSLPFDNRPWKETCNRARIEHLSITLCKDNFLFGEWLCQPRCSIDLTHLHTLGITYDPDYNGHCTSLVSRILKHAGRSLKTLGIRRQKLGEPLTLNSIPWKLSHNPSLRSLTLDITPLVIYPTSLCPPRWVVPTLMHLSQPSPIEELIVRLIVQDSPHATVVGSDYSGWIYMASWLTSESFPSLTLVKIVITRPLQHWQLFEYMAREKIRNLGMRWTLRMSVDCSAL